MHSLRTGAVLVLHGHRTLALHTHIQMIKSCCMGTVLLLNWYCKWYWCSAAKSRYATTVRPIPCQGFRNGVPERLRPRRSQATSATGGQVRVERASPSAWWCATTRAPSERADGRARPGQLHDRTSATSRKSQDEDAACVTPHTTPGRDAKCRACELMQKWWRTMIASSGVFALDYIVASLRGSRGARPTRCSRCTDCGSRSHGDGLSCGMVRSAPIRHAAAMRCPGARGRRGATTRNKDRRAHPAEALNVSKPPTSSSEGYATPSAPPFSYCTCVDRQTSFCMSTQSSLPQAQGPIKHGIAPACKACSVLFHAGRCVPSVVRVCRTLPGNGQS